MAYNVTEEYREIVYSGDANYDCRLYFNNYLVPNEQIQYIKISSPIIDTSSNTGSMYHIGTFISQKIEIKFRNLNELDVTSNPNIYLEIGLKVNDNYEYVPIGYYLIDELGENYQQTCTITCLDYAVKFKSQLDISQFMNEDKYIYASDLFEAICRYYGVETGTYPTTNNYKKIYQYDSDLSGKDYISFLAELFGGNAKIGRDGKCYIFELNGSTSKETEGEKTTLENTQESKANFNIEGKCEQDKYEGYNIMPYALASSTTINGITFTSYGDGKYSIKGTATATAQATFDLIKTFTIPKSIGNSGNGCMYLFNSQNNDKVFLHFRNSGTLIDYWKATPINRVATTFTSQENKVCNQITLDVSSGETVDMEISPMFTNDGTSNKQFEQYVGGKPSPNPDYPQEIKTVGVWNLWDGNYDKAYVGGTTQNVYILNDAARTAVIKCKPNTTYTVNKIDTSNRFTIASYSSRINTNTELDIIIIDHSINSYTFTTNNNAKYLYVYVSNQNEEPRIVVNEGPTVSPYIKHGEGNVQIKTNSANLLSLKNNTYTINGVTTIVKDGEITINGTATQTTFLGLMQNEIIDYSSMQYFTVYLFNDKLQEGLRFRIDSGGQQDIPAYYHVNEVSTLSYNSGFTYQTAMLRIENGTTFNDVKLRPMIINGTNTKMPYMEYKKNKIVLPLQKNFYGTEDFKDTFVKENGKWYEKHYYKKYIFNGTEAFYTDSYNRIHMPVPTDMLYSTTEPNKYQCLSNRFTFDIDIFYNVSANVFGVYQSGRLYFSLNGTNITTREQWLDYIKQNELYIIYPLKEPELITCTEEQTKILENGLQIYDNFTYIESETNTKIKYMEKTIPLEIDAITSKSFEVGDIYEISRICFDDGKLKLQGGANVISVEELPTQDFDTSSTYYLTKEMKYYNYVNDEWIINQDIKNTLYLRTNNLLITNQNEVDNIYEILKGFKIYNLKCENRIDLSLDCWDLINYVTDKGQYLTLYDNNVNFNGVTMGKTEVKLPISLKEETTNIVRDSINSKINRIKTILNEQEGTISTIATTTQEIKSNLSETETTVHNNYQEIIDKLGDYAKTDELISVQNSVTTIQSSTQYAIEVAESIKTNGVERVTTTTGFTFDEDGLTVEKTGAHTKSILDETGLDVRDTTSGSEEDLLFAGVDSVTGEAIVKSKNITVDKYLVVGKYTRFEDYKDASNVNWTGAFWIGG